MSRFPIHHKVFPPIVAAFVVEVYGNASPEGEYELLTATSFQTSVAALKRVDELMSDHMVSYLKNGYTLYLTRDVPLDVYNNDNVVQWLEVNVEDADADYTSIMIQIKAVS